MNYKVEYLHTTKESKKWYNSPNPVDGWTLAKELEACIVEYESKGYDVHTVQAINTTTEVGGAITDGVLVVFKRFTKSSI